MFVGVFDMGFVVDIIRPTKEAVFRSEPVPQIPSKALLQFCSKIFENFQFKNLITIKVLLRWRNQLRRPTFEPVLNDLLK